MRSSNVVLTIVFSLGAIAACGGDDDAADGTAVARGPASPPVGSPATTDISTTSVAVDDTTAATNAPATTTPDTAAVSTTTAPTAGPLPEPAVSLFEIGTFDQPVQVASRPFDSRAYVVEQPGRVIATDAESTITALDITELTEAAGERGLLGLAFHPDADLAYVNHTDLAGDTVIAELAVDPTTGTFDRASYREVLTVDQPFGNHNGGQIAFGPDGLLYIGLGDGGSADDPNRNALDVSSRLGKLLRIDPAAGDGTTFTVPGDNPFLDVEGADPTIWAIGLRNPWRFSFDPANGDLWIADVGQNVWEEINHAPATGGVDAGRGLSFGWSAFEGFDRFNSDQTAEFPPAGHTAPRFVYDHSDSRCSVSGGAVARGEFASDLTGWFVFGDYCSGDIWALDPTAPLDEPRTILVAELDTLVAISTGPDGDLYAVSNAGTVARIDTA